VIPPFPKELNVLEGRPGRVLRDAKIVRDHPRNPGKATGSPSPKRGAPHGGIYKEEGLRAIPGCLE